MAILNELYRQPLGLLTDLYQLTMAYGYWKLARQEQEAVFTLNYRTNPFAGGFAVAAGLGPVIDYINSFALGEEDLSFLATLKGNDRAPLFAQEFLSYLKNLRLSIDVDAVPEGTVVFANEPLLRVRGPMLQAQILETPILNLFNFQTLIATKAARVCIAARGDPVIEFGLRRAQGIDGALAATRAAYVGGVQGTSNVLAGRLYGIPVGGTHAHSWVMSFASELEAFNAYAGALPNNCVFLVDTYNTLEGVRHAIQVGKALRQRGHKLAGIRLDSGDLAYLSIEARKILDAGGFHDANILASNDLDENIITSLKDQGARINVWGVGTRLVTAYDQAALGGVYKLTAIHEPGHPWQYKVKLSEQTVKINTPGILQTRRFVQEGHALADMVFDLELGPPPREATIVDPRDFARRKKIPDGTEFEDLLVPVFRGGACVYDRPPLSASRTRTAEQLARFHPGIKRFLNPHEYPVGLEQSLHDLKTRLILAAREMVAR